MDQSAISQLGFQSQLINKQHPSLIFFFFIIPIFIHDQIFKIYLKNKSKIIYYRLSLITFYTLDQNFSLWGIAKHGILNINLNSPYLNSILSAIVSIIFIYFLFYFSKKNALRIIFSDHDSRFEISDNIENNVIYFHKEKNSKTSKIKNDKISINSLLYSLSID